MIVEVVSRPSEILAITTTRSGGKYTSKILILQGFVSIDADGLQMLLAAHCTVLLFRIRVLGRDGVGVLCI